MRVAWSLLVAAALPALAAPAALDGDPAMHDPSTVIEHAGRQYAYGTGAGLPAPVSDGGWIWRRAGSRELRDVRLSIGSNAAPVWWLDGQRVISLYNDRQTVIDDGVSRRVTPDPGRPVIRAAIINGGGATDFCARFLDATDRPITGLNVRPGA